MAPKISVIMPVYNTERYLADAIESILSQDFKDFEFIIINDGSSDNSKSIIESYNDPRIILINNEQNLGITKSMNNGLNIAKGYYIARMDSDDICLPHRLRLQAEYLDKSTDIGFVGGAAYHINSDGHFIGAYQQPTNSLEACTQALISLPFYNPTLMFRRSLIKENNLRYNENIKSYADDFDFISSAIKYSKFSNIPNILVLFRIHQNSICGSGQEKQNEACVNIAYKNVKNIFDEIENEDETKQILRHFYNKKISNHDEWRKLDELSKKIIEKYRETLPKSINSSSLNSLRIKWLFKIALRSRYYRAFPSMIIMPGFWIFVLKMFKMTLWKSWHNIFAHKKWFAK